MRIFRSSQIVHSFRTLAGNYDYDAYKLQIYIYIPMHSSGAHTNFFFASRYVLHTCKIEHGMCATCPLSYSDNIIKFAKGH